MNMQNEVNVALHFLVSYMYNKLPRRRVDLFAEELARGMKSKFQGHWYPELPFKGSGYRCLHCSGNKVDPVILRAAHSVGLSAHEVQDCIPAELTLWVDPSEVSYRLGERMAVRVLYCGEELGEGECVEVVGDAPDDDLEIQAMERQYTFNPEAACFQPIEAMASSFTNLHLGSPTSPVPCDPWAGSPLGMFSPTGRLMMSPPPIPPMPQQQQPSPMYPGKVTYNNPQFTAASFAATKFGSTKLKCSAKRPNRLSPTELGTFFRAQNQQPQPHQQQHPGFVGLPPAPAPRPRSLSPPDPRYDFFMEQQRFYPAMGPFPFMIQGPPPMAFSPISPGMEMMRHSAPSLQQTMGVPAFPEMLSPGGSSSGSLSSMQSSLTSLSPEGHKSFMEDLQGMQGYPGPMPHLLVAN